MEEELARYIYIARGRVAVTSGPAEELHKLRWAELVIEWRKQFKLAVVR